MRLAVPCVGCSTGNSGKRGSCKDGRGVSGWCGAAGGLGGGSGGSERSLNPPEAGETALPCDPTAPFLPRSTLAILFPPRASLLISALHGRAWAFWMKQHPILPPGCVMEYPRGGLRGCAPGRAGRGGPGGRWGCFGCCGRERGATYGYPPVLQWWGSPACSDPPTSPNGG